MGAWGLAVLSGVLQVLPFPIAGPVPTWRTAIAWIAMVPLLLALVSNDREGRRLRVRDVAVLGYLCGFIWYLGNCYWIYQTMHLYGGLPAPVAAAILVLFCLYLGLYHALFGALLGLLRCSKRLGRSGALVAAPFVWVAVELARARITGFPWDLMGNAHVDNSLLTLVAPWGGVYAMSLILMLANAQLASFFVFKEPLLRWQALGTGVLMVLFFRVGGHHVLFVPPAPAPTARAVLLQENIEVGAANVERLNTADELRMFTALSRQAIAPSMPPIISAGGERAVVRDVAPTLVVWPEAPSGFQTNDPSFMAAMGAMARDTHAPVIAGSLGVVADGNVERGYRLYDSAAFFDASGAAAGRYDKVHLVPWGEYIPFKEFFFFAKKLTAGVGDMDRGQGRKLFEADGKRYGVFVCYESIFADEVRQFVKQGAEVLVNISDDGWYGDSGAPWQHLNMVRMRAVENRRWILRSTNTGVTVAIDPYGRVFESAPRHVRAAVEMDFGYENAVTFYTKFGDMFAYLCAAGTIVLCGLALRSWRGAA